MIAVLVLVATLAASPAPSASASAAPAIVAVPSSWQVAPIPANERAQTVGKWTNGVADSESIVVFVGPNAGLDVPGFANFYDRIVYALTRSSAYVALFSYPGYPGASVD